MTTTVRIAMNIVIMPTKFSRFIDGLSTLSRNTFKVGAASNMQRTYILAILYAFELSSVNIATKKVPREITVKTTTNPRTKKLSRKCLNVCMSDCIMCADNGQLYLRFSAERVFTKGFIKQPMR